MRRSFLVLKMPPIMPLGTRERIYRRRGIGFLCLEVISEVAIADNTVMNFAYINRSANLS